MRTCMISFLLLIVIYSASWITHVKGQTVRLQGSSPSAVRNETFQFTCTVTGSGSLPEGLSFQRGTGTSPNLPCIVNAGTCSQFINSPGYTCECVSGQTRVFYMNITSASTDDEGSWRCHYSGIDSNTISLDVVYGPGITSVPTNKQVIENASPDIDCSGNITSGNPPTTRYRWTGPGGYSKDGAVLDRLVNRNQGGMYTCTATNTAGLSDTAQVNVTVQYAPAITTVPTNKNVTENASPDIDCSSNITNGNPSTTRYSWTGPGEYSKDGVVLDRLVNRNQGGVYTCTATNTAGLSDTAQVNVTVQYAPAITSVPNNQNVTENASLDIDCSSNITPGNPSTTTSYRWTGPRGYSKDGAVLDRLVNRNQGGVYTCTATTSAGLSDTALVNIDIQYAPVIANLPPETNVTENFSPSIDCSSNITRGNPSTTSFRWTGPGGYSKDGAVLDRLVDRNQGGMYTCTATNTAGLSDTAQVNINVQYGPQRNMQKDYSRTIYRKINDTAAMMATAAANPLPHFTWWRNDSGHLDNIDNATDYTVFSSDLQTVLIVRVAHSRDYGTYALRMNNSFGESILLYTLSQAPSATGQPQPDQLGRGIGIGVGVSLSALVVVVIIVLMCRNIKPGRSLKKRRKKRRNHYQDPRFMCDFGNQSYI